MQIDKDVPMPPKKKEKPVFIPHSRTKPLRDLFIEMCVGDSVFFASQSMDKVAIKSHRNNIYAMAKRVTEKDGSNATFETRRVNENGVAGFRIWRTS